MCLAPWFKKYNVISKDILFITGYIKYKDVQIYDGGIKEGFS